MFFSLFIEVAVISTVNFRAFLSPQKGPCFPFIYILEAQCTKVVHLGASSAHFAPYPSPGALGRCPTDGLDSFPMESGPKLADGHP